MWRRLCSARVKRLPQTYTEWIKRILVFWVALIAGYQILTSQICGFSPVCWTEWRSKCLRLGSDALHTLHLNFFTNVWPSSRLMVTVGTDWGRCCCSCLTVVFKIFLIVIPLLFDRFAAATAADGDVLVVVVVVELLLENISLRTPWIFDIIKLPRKLKHCS